MSLRGCRYVAGPCQQQTGLVHDSMECTAELRACHRPLLAKDRSDAGISDSAHTTCPCQPGRYGHLYDNMGRTAQSGKMP